MREGTRHQHEVESSSDRMINGYADAAVKLSKEYRWPHNVWTAIRSEQGTDRVTIFCSVVDELARRKKQHQDTSIHHNQIIDLERFRIRREEFLKGAYQNERSQPRDAWNTSDEKEDS